MPPLSSVSTGVAASPSLQSGSELPHSKGVRLRPDAGDRVGDVADGAALGDVVGRRGDEDADVFDAAYRGELVVAM